MNPKRPLYTPEEQLIADELNRRISNGDTDAYMELTRLAVKVAVDENRFTRSK